MAAKAPKDRRVRPSSSLIVWGLALLAVASFLWDLGMQATLRDVIAGVETTGAPVALTGTGIGIVGLCLTLAGVRRLLGSVDLVAQRLTQRIEAPAPIGTSAPIETTPKGTPPQIVEEHA